MAITYNNMSCLFKRKGLLKTSLGYAEKALKLETQSSKVDNPACTHLNLCAILSCLGRHQHALEHCQVIYKAALLPLACAREREPGTISPTSRHSRPSGLAIRSPPPAT
mmetsp:Transcript_88821/g.236464  ORF Transcript_88821/g.236464 Transcript_88821/m.236464 type:complete len:109 (-) Transcript_88821:23-349(-)